MKYVLGIAICLTGGFGACTSNAEICNVVNVGQNSLPAGFASIGRSLTAVTEPLRRNSDCDPAESCIYRDASGLEYGAIRTPHGNFEVVTVSVNDFSRFTGTLPMRLTPNDPPWQIIRKLLAADEGFPTLGVYRRATGEIVLATGYCLRFPSGEIGSLSAWFDDDGSLLRFALELPWEGD
jgi:hypothetical protein